MKKFKISIITVCLNSEKTIERAIQSVLNQNYDKKNIQHIIIDGKSKDNTIKIIKKYQKKIYYWESEKDGGIYNAMNKGIKKSSGDIIGILNSDDFYYKNTFQIVNNYFNKFNLDYLFGSVDHLKLYHGFYPEKIWYKLNIYPAHSVGFFIKKKIQMKIGLYDENIQYASDRDLFYKLIRYKNIGLATKKNEVFGKFNPDGISTKLSYSQLLKEEFKVRKGNKQNVIFIIFLLLIKSVYKFILTIIRKIL